MYHSDAGVQTALHAGAQKKGVRVGATVYLLGLTSLLTDISSEMVASVLPVYLLTVLRLSPFEFGLIDGLYNGAVAVVRLAAGYLSDLTRRHKAIAFIGYLLSAISRCGLFIAGVAGWASTAAVILVDRIGKGIRTAPRDAMIAAQATPDTLGASFGVHRAMDAVGAVLGPLLAAGILLWLPRRFDIVFASSIFFAVLGLSVLGLFVRHRPMQAHPSAITFGATLHALKAPRFMLLALTATLLSVFTLSDNMLYMGLQRRLQFDASLVPLLFVGTALVFMLLAVPAGRLADRFGHLRIFLLGYVLLALAYGLFSVLPPLNFTPIIFVVLLGTYYAATDGVMAALAAQQLPVELRATGIAWVTTLVSLGRMASSILFGWTWEKWGHTQAVGWFAVCMITALSITLMAAMKIQKRR
ncbi:MAG: MFS transporter [Burkholderiales bacterium]|nr:MFS transporter [Burkholderiales bacterium]